MSKTVHTAIVAINSKYIHSSLAPWCLYASVREFASAEVVEGTINEPTERLLERIIANKPDVVAFSCYIWNITTVERILPQLRQSLPRVTILLGGPEVSYRVEDAFLKTKADFILCGEGEEPFAHFLKEFSKEVPNFQSVPGLSYPVAEGYFVAEPYITNTIPKSPYTPEYFEALKGRIAYLETSRGCPFSCAYCLSGRCGKPRFYPIERAQEELLLLANSGTKTVKLVDRTFNANPSRAYELWSFLYQHLPQLPEEVCFHFEIAGDLLDEKSIRLLSAFPPGRIQLEIGLQSFSEKTLAAVCRKTDTQKLKERILALTAAGNLHIHVDLIAGLPNENYDTFAESFNTAYALRPQMLQLGFLKLIHGSPMRENPQEYPCTYAQNPPYEVVETPWLSYEELQQLHQIEDILERMFNSGRFLGTVDYLLSETKCTPFALFEQIALGIGTIPSGTTLHRFAELLFKRLPQLFSLSNDRLRDELVCDLLATDASGRLPLALDPKDSRIAVLRRQLDESEKTRRKDGVRRGMAILKTKPQAVYVDYVAPHPITGRYSLQVLTISEK